MVVFAATGAHVLFLPLLLLPLGAHDKTSGVPVRNFKHSNRLYGLPIKKNRGLDRDHDGIACEST